MRRRTSFSLVGIISIVAIAGALAAVYSVVSIAGAVATVYMERRHTATQSAVIPPKCLHDRNLRTYEEWKRTVVFPYVAPESKLLRVKNNYSRIDVGSSMQEVIRAFGPPDSEIELYPKEPDRPCLGYGFTYFFEKPDADNTNEINDKTIQAFFSHDGRLDWIVGNVGLPEKGSPAHHP